MISKDIIKTNLKKISQFIFLDWKNKHGEIKLWKITLYLYIVIQMFLTVFFDSYIVQIKDTQIIMNNYRVVAYDFSSEKTLMFEIEDSLVYGIYDAPGMFGKINKDGFYYVKTVGFRIPFPYFQIFPNIISLKEITVTK